MVEHICPGLPADWLNGWLAAIGATVLVNGLHLRWTDEPIPVAVLVGPDGVSIPDAIASALPAIEDLDASPIARSLHGFDEVGLNLSFDQFAERAALARESSLGWTLSSFYADALLDGGAAVADKGPFLPPMPGKKNAPYDRLDKLIGALDLEQIEASLDGVGKRSQQFGLGFDLNRIGSLADATDHWVDPVVELMAFAGLSLFPTRGDGSQVEQRGWSKPRTHRDGFTWAAWCPPLDRDGIDAFLDLFWSRPELAQRLGVAGRWGSVPYVALGGSDATRGFGSHRMEKESEGRGA